MRSRCRIHIPEALYYITVVTYRRVDIFSNSANARLMLQVIDQQRRRYGLCFYEFVLMPDHYHFIIAPPRGRKIGETVRHINGVFGLQYNRIRGQSGRVFQPDYYDHVVRDDEDYIRIAEYIHNNPVRAGLVERP
ncbi:MAG: transposase, partial [Pseudomonadota bacterium]